MHSGHGICGEKKISKKDVPATVLKAFDQSYPKAKANGYSTETEHGQTYYEVESTDGKTTRNLLYKPDGTVVEIEESVTMSDLPDAVSKAFTQAASGAKATKIEKITKNGKVVYEFAMGKGKSEMVIEPWGQVVKQSKGIDANKEKEEAAKRTNLQGRTPVNRHLTFLLCLLWTSSASAQQSMTLEQCLRVARANSVALHVTENSARATQLAKSENQSIGLPQVRLSSGVSYAPVHASQDMILPSPMVDKSLLRWLFRNLSSMPASGA